MNKPRTLSYFVMIIAIVAVLELLNGILLRGTGGYRIIWILLEIIGLVLVFWGGRASKMAGGHPVGRGALMGAVFGLIAGIAGFFYHVSADDLQSQLGDSAAATVNTQGLADMVNSPALHVVTFLFSIVLYAVGGLIVGAIGGATVKKPEQMD